MKFLNTGFVREANITQFYEGDIKDPCAGSHWGLGYMGEGGKHVPYRKRAHELWRSVPRRCYDPLGPSSDHYRRGVQVAVRWLNFSLFLEDLPKLEGFDRWLAGGRVELDKDKKGSSLYYSRETCVFLSKSENPVLRVIWNRGLTLDKTTWKWVPKSDLTKAPAPVIVCPIPPGGASLKEM